MKTKQLFIQAVLALTSLACGAEEEAPAEASSTDAPPEPAPPNNPAETVDPGATGPLCNISADCPEGTHCDLGECVEACSSAAPCPGDQTCTERGRCVDAGKPDQDPEPPTASVGQLTVSPTAVQLTEQDQAVELTLTSNVADTVRYRVELRGKHLDLAEPRGKLVGSTRLRINVAPPETVGEDMTGSIRIISTLGEIIVDAPIHVGRSGRYQGSMRYDDGISSLGDARIVMDLQEEPQGLLVQLDPEASLLFPETSAGPASGIGTYAPGGDLDLHVGQLIDATFGGERNHFQRALGRKVRFALQPAADGDLTGRFDEEVYGLAGDRVRLTGSVQLRRIPHAQRLPLTATQITMPVAPSSGTFYEPSVIGWKLHCKDTLTWECSGVGGLQNRNECFGEIEAKHYAMRVLSAENLLQQQRVGACRQSLLLQDLASDKGIDCPVFGPLACAAQEAAKGGFDDVDNGRALGRLLAKMTAPAMIVAQDELVLGLDSTFKGESIQAEIDRYENALNALGGALRWTFQPGVLEYLHRMSPDAAAGEAGVGTPGYMGDTREPGAAYGYDYPAARAIARLLQVSGIVDAELSRVSVMSGATAADQHARITQAQERALLTHLESAVLASIIKTWSERAANSIAPAAAVTVLSGVLTPLDQAFASLLRGAGVFGVPDGFIPFVYRPSDPGANNFEQMFAMAQESVAGAKAIEDEYIGNARSFENDQYTLAQELLQMRQTFDAQIAGYCGTSFDPATSGWEACGASGGEAGIAILHIQQAQAELRAAESLIVAKRDQLAIDQRVLAETQEVHQDKLRFIEETGEELEGLVLAEGIINATKAALEIAAQSSIGNLGLPAGIAVAGALLEGQRTGLNMRRQQLDTAMKMREAEHVQKLELIRGMGELKKQIIDIAQLGVEIQTKVIGVLEADLRARDAVDQARRVFAERQRAEAVAGTNPAHDPTFRIVRDSLGLTLIAKRARAQRYMHLAGRALEYEINRPLPALTASVVQSRSAQRLERLRGCFDEIYQDYKLAVKAPETYKTTVSIRELLGITGIRTDPVTGIELSPGEQFRMRVLRNDNLTAGGGLTVRFATNLQPGNPLWSSNVCHDRIQSMRAQLVGDFLGDDEAEIDLTLSGAAVVRNCDSADSLQTWSLGQTAGSGAFAVLQAGVNSFGSAPANVSLFGQSVARATWELTLPGGDVAPANADIDLSKLEDIVLEIDHGAFPLNDGLLSVDTSCLALSGS